MEATNIRAYTLEMGPLNEVKWSHFKGVSPNRCIFLR